MTKVDIETGKGITEDRAARGRGVAIHPLLPLLPRAERPPETNRARPPSRQTKRQVPCAIQSGYARVCVPSVDVLCCGGCGGLTPRLGICRILGCSSCEESASGAGVYKWGAVDVLCFLPGAVWISDVP